MKRTSNNTLKTISIFALLIIMGACSDLLNNPLKDKKTGEEITLLLLDMNIFETRFSFHFVDSETGEYIDNKTIQVFFEGKSAEHIINYEGEKNKSYTVTNGRLNLTFDPNIEVSEENPIDFTVYTNVSDFSYDAFPTQVYFTKTGNIDKDIQMINFNKSQNTVLKSASISPGNEPFDVLFNFSKIKTENDPVWQMATFTKTQDNKTYYSIFRSLFPPNGTLASRNFSLAENNYENWGLEGMLYYGTTVNSFNLTNENVTLTDSPNIAKAYSATQIKNLTHCTSGINITVNNSSKNTGSAVFRYKLYIDDVLVAYQRVSGNKMPFTSNTGAFYYPNDAQKAYIKFYGDTQYNIEPEQVNLSSICGQNVEITASAKDGLVPHKIIVQFKCPGNPVAMAPSINGQYRKKNSDDSWTYFKFTEGTTTVMLTPDKTYTFKAQLTDTEAEFDIPTNISMIEQAITQAKKDIFEIQDMDINITEQSDGTIVIKAIVLFKEDECPI